MNTGQYRTFIIFADLPRHFEFMTPGWPILQEGDKIDMNMNIRNPMNPKKTRKIEGLYEVTRKYYKHSSDDGFIQYLELSVVDLNKQKK